MKTAWLAGATLLLVGLGASTVAGQPTGPTPSRNKPELVTGHKVIDKQLFHLRELIGRLRKARSDVFGVTGGGRPMSPVIGDPQTQLAARLGHDLNLLEESLLVLHVAEAASRSGLAPVESTSVTAAGAVADLTLELPQAGDFAPVRLEIANLGDEPIVNPRLVFDGQRDWFDVDAVVSEVLAGAEGELDRAQRLWEFLVENRYHSVPPAPRTEVVDPIKLLNVYGYGHADGAAGAFAALARHAGLQVRLWRLNGHVVPEVLCEGLWRMFDCDAEAFFTGPLGGPASVAELQGDPALLLSPVLIGSRDKPRYSAPTLHRIWSRGESHRLMDFNPPESPHDMGFTLRPGERIAYQWDHQGLRVPEVDYKVPERFANGRWVYDYELASGETPPIELDLDLPYPILAGSVSVRFASISSRRDWAVEARGEDGEWHALPWGPSAERVFPASIGSALSATGLGPDYSVSVRLVPTHADARAKIDWMRVELVFQLSPQSLPRLLPGRNVARWTSDSSGAAASVRYDFRDQTGAR